MCDREPPIDRQAIVRRHNVVLTRFSPDRPLQVGNGGFAFGMDITGLQTFAPLNIMSNWGWASSPLPPGVKVSDYQYQPRETHGRIVTYPLPDPKHPQISDWLAANPHRIDLGRIGLILLKKDGSRARADDLDHIRQTLDLWSGIVTSLFELEGSPVRVVTSCDPSRDQIGIRIESPLVSQKRLGVFLDCLGDTDAQFQNFVGDWAHPAALKAVTQTPTSLVLRRDLGTDSYFTSLGWQQGDLRSPGSAGQFSIWSSTGDELDLCYGFTRSPVVSITTPQTIERRSARAWKRFWQSGGAIDFSQCRDPRAAELERRVVLSQYLMGVQEAGDLPPQESGLVNNGWFGKFHMEMLWWHAAHWALWNRWREFEAESSIYKRLLPEAEQIAKREGYRGARWPKALGDDFHEWPHEIHSLLVWQQTHPLFFAELDYAAHPTEATLKKWAPIVQASADFMASYAWRNPKTGKYDLGPPMQLASENVPSEDARNPTFELAQWRFGLRIARQWRQRMHLPENAIWKQVEDRLAPLPVQDGQYVLYEGVKDMWSKWNFEHPALIGTYGMLPGDGVDPALMRATLDQLVRSWNFGRTWGWDYPMLAMCAARLGRPDQAISFLLTESGQFQFDERGLATGGPFPYFPSNGGLLYAVAMMAGGWQGSSGPAPGFPKSWKVRYEGLGIAP